MTVFIASPLSDLDSIKEKGLEHKVVHLVRHAQGARGRKRLVGDPRRGRGAKGDAQRPLW